MTTTHISSPTVLLVNEQDEILGTAEKLAVHESGDLHRAFSVLIFNDQGEYLLQQRAHEKYHSGGLWSNTCCGHPSHPHDTAEQAQQRLYEEMGFRTTLKPLFSFRYHAELPNGLTEHEFDHVFMGHYQGPIPFNSDEACAVRWIAPDDLAQEMRSAPHTFSVWFRMLFERLQKRS
ncbi:isopentenyl-diphosphate Delta-isomerase [Spirosoma agri]|uniref:Isopentenyl-diphosphate delta-isomerase n=1 Tax=Spirosoma agri TaxID=1987381 RepID=A0A6M0IFF8_9BACT|nr:isopentenyl-diphosphate Delta-isomerase [Spirosoma agri]NEU66101.1 isopentenyl-diphosphate Delta-isomerase [Spirosoma agri]